jgi:predicted aldo/keto reductase-like oxidoreductase
VAIPNDDERPARREFLRNVGALGTGAMLSGALAANATAQAGGSASKTRAGSIPRRAFGKSGVEVSALGVGGHAIGLAKLESEAIRIVREAIDAGATFLDNAWEYHDGRSEEWMGKALEGRRDQAFLMTKVCTHGRDAKVAMQQLEQSLKRLKTDRVDLWQVHECVYHNDPERHFAKGGVIEALDQAKKDGKVRFVGFTGHKDPEIHLAMLAHDYPFDAVQLPLNVFDASFKSFEQRVLPELVRRGIAPIAMKSLNGTGDAIKKGVLTVEEALRYTLSLPIATLVSGMDSLGVLHQNLAIARGFEPMSAAEMQALRERVASQAGDGRFELYKISMRFEGPPGREQHGLPPPEKMPS